MDESLQKQSRELSTAVGTSPSHLTISRLMERAAQVYQSEILPGQMRVWLECFQGESAEMLESGFSEYFATGKFFPKPADIKEIIRIKRASTFVSKYMPIDREQTKREQETKEWEASSLKARRLLAKLAGRSFDPQQNSPEKLKQQAAELMKKRGTVPTVQPPNVSAVATKESMPEKP